MRLKRGRLGEGEVRVVLEELPGLGIANSKRVDQILYLTCETEVAYFSSAVFGNQNVRRLQITVDYTSTVHVIKPTEEVVHDRLHMILSNDCL